MTIEEFLTAKLDRIASVTGIDISRWSRYLRGKVAINLRTLYAAAEKLEMSPDELLKAIQMRQEINSKKNKKIA